MPTVTEHLRKRMHDRLGIETKPKRAAHEVSAEILSMTEKLDEITKLAKDRLIMGGIRYGSQWEHQALMGYMQSKFDNYKKTGNYEMLVDLFNFVVIEGVLKTHSNHHFKAIDRS